ncbi:MAG: methyltransferase [Clostridia bacterium]|nr:methyltransferase [Clostridia bacterium]
MERLEDLMIGGLKIYQDDDLYCFTSDSILLTKFVSVKKNDIVADFCSGSGIVGLHLYALNPTIKKVYLFELQKELSSLSKKSVELNGLTEVFDVQNIPIQKIGNEFNNYFSLITVNPPFFKKDTQKALDIKIAICREEITVNLEEIIKIASKKLKFGGRFNMVNKSDRLAEIFYLMKSYKLEPKKLQFVKNGDKEPYLVMVEGVKGGKEGLKILKTLEN